MFGESSVKKWATIAGLVVMAAGFAYHVSSHPMDFRVYHYGARGVFDGTRPVYGLSSGLGWPMHYRYPPLFLLLFAPLAMLPLGTAAAIWVVAKVVVLAWLLRAIRKRAPHLLGQVPLPPGEGGPKGRVRESATKSLRVPTLTRRFPFGFALSGSRSAAAPSPGERGTSYLISFFFIAPFLIEEFRYGNAQFFVVALTIAALLVARERPMLSAAGLALGISIKVWPAFFLPYLLVRRDWKPVAYALGFVVILALLPALYFGVSGNFTLLGQWFAQESHTQLSESEIWFPNQSLRGVLMRYLTAIDYSQVPDSNYPAVNVASLDPAKVRLLWMIVAAGTYCLFLLSANRRREGDGWFDHALAFCLLALLEPFTQKYALAVLLWPAIAAAALMKNPRRRIFIYCATVLVLIQPLAPGASAQRLLQVLGMDFAATVLLTIAVASAVLHDRDRRTSPTIEI